MLCNHVCTAVVALSQFCVASSGSDLLTAVRASVSTLPKVSWELKWRSIGGVSEGGGASRVDNCSVLTVKRAST